MKKNVSRIPDFIIHVCTDLAPCEKFPEGTKMFPENLMDCHTHNLLKYKDKDGVGWEYQVVLADDECAIYILNCIQRALEKGTRFHPGDYVDDIFDDCKVFMLETEDSDGKPILRCCVPDMKGRQFFDEGCDAPYVFQFLTTKEIMQMAELDHEEMKKMHPNPCKRNACFQ